MFNCKDIFKDRHTYMITNDPIFNIHCKYYISDNADMPQSVVRFSVDGYSHSGLSGYIDIAFDNPNVIYYRIRDITLSTNLDIKTMSTLLRDAKKYGAGDRAAMLSASYIGDCYRYIDGIHPNVAYMITAIDFENSCIELTCAGADDGVNKKYIPFKDIPYVKEYYHRMDWIDE